MGGYYKTLLLFVSVSAVDKDTKLGIKHGRFNSVFVLTPWIAALRDRMLCKSVVEHG